MASLSARTFFAACAIAAALATGCRQSERSKTTAVRVTSAGELIAAIGPGKVIRLAPGTYDLTDLPRKDSPYVFREKIYGGQQTVIRNVPGLSIRGPRKGAAKIVTTSTFANVLSFKNVKGLRLADLAFSHAPKPTDCAGGVVALSTCEDIRISNCQLSGSGVEGLTLKKVKRLTFENSQIRDCTEGIMTVSGSADLSFVGSRFENNACFHYFRIRGSRNVVFDRCRIADNGGANSFIFEPAVAASVCVRRSSITDNRAAGLALLPESLKIESTTLRGNSFADPRKLVPTAGSYVYRVRRGDFLCRLANAFYGDEERWPVIARANRLKNPDLIEVGQKLRIPRFTGELLAGVHFADRLPFQIRSDLKLALDIEGDGKAEEISFEALSARSVLKDDGSSNCTEEDIYCVIAKGGKPAARFKVDRATNHCTVTIEDFLAWRASKTEIIFVVKTSRDHRAATASIDGKVHFFLITSDLKVRKLLSIDGDEVHHLSASGGWRKDTAVRLLRGRGPRRFAVRHVGRAARSEWKEDMRYDRGFEETTAYVLTYDARRKKLVKGKEKVAREKGTAIYHERAGSAASFRYRLFNRMVQRKEGSGFDQYILRRGDARPVRYYTHYRAIRSVVGNKMKLILINDFCATKACHVRIADIDARKNWRIDGPALKMYQRNARPSDELIVNARGKAFSPDDQLVLLEVHLEYLMTGQSKNETIEQEAARLRRSFKKWWYAVEARTGRVVREYRKDPALRKWWKPPATKANARRPARR